VQIADVHPEAEIGHVAFARSDAIASGGGKEAGGGRLRKGRLYD